MARVAKSGMGPKKGVTDPSRGIGMGEEKGVGGVGDGGVTDCKSVSLPPLILRGPQHERPHTTGEGTHEGCPYGEGGPFHTTLRDGFPIGVGNDG